MGSLWNRSGTVERYADDLRASGAKAYFFEGGTTTPLTVFQDAGEGSSFATPVVADANGRWPDIFVPFIASYDVRVTSADNVQLTYTLEIPNPDPIGTVVPPVNDPLKLIQTGMIHAELINTTKIGFVRLNGRTLGNAASGATERANADTEALFTYLWDNLLDAVAPVSGGRGGSAAADYAVNKNIVLPDCRGRVLMGLDDMGNAPATNIDVANNITVGSAVTAGSALGDNAAVLTATQMPSHVHTGNTGFSLSAAFPISGTTDVEATHTHTGTTSSDGIHGHTVKSANVALGSDGQVMTAASTGSPDNTPSTTSDGAHVHGFTSDAGSAHAHNFSTTANLTHLHTFTTAATGGADILNNAPFSVLITWFIKL